MIKLVVSFALQINGKDYRITLDQDSPLNDSKEFALQFLKWLGTIEDKAKEAQEALEKEKAAQETKEEPKPEQV